MVLLYFFQPNGTIKMLKLTDIKEYVLIDFSTLHMNLAHLIQQVENKTESKSSTEVIQCTFKIIRSLYKRNIIQVFKKNENDHDDTFSILDSDSMQNEFNVIINQPCKSNKMQITPEDLNYEIALTALGKDIIFT